MKFEIIRTITYPFGDDEEEEWAEEESDNIYTLTKEMISQNSSPLHLNIYDFQYIDLKNNTALFIITNRNRYKGDTFLIKPKE